MSFIGKSILKKAQEQNVAIAGFDTFNTESAQAVVEAANETGLPVFIQTGIVSAGHLGLQAIAATLTHSAKECKNDFCVHLDHGLETSDKATLIKAMDLGFQSIMVDGSKLSFDENIRFTKGIVELAHPRGICVEAELGKVSHDAYASKEKLDSYMTDPDQAAQFVERTGIDYLAVSVGSVSGFYKKIIELNLERLSVIKKKVAVPLVFHGGTSIPEDQLKEAVKIGICKVNIAHGLRKSFLDGITEWLRQNPEEIDPRKVLDNGRRAAKDYAMVKMRQLWPSE